MQYRLPYMWVSMEAIESTGNILAACQALSRNLLLSSFSSLEDSEDESRTIPAMVARIRIQGRSHDLYRCVCKIEAISLLGRDGIYGIE